MDNTLSYLKEILSNYTDDHTEGRFIYKKLIEGAYNSESSFVRELTQKEIHFLNNILPKEISHAKEVQDNKRAYQLNEVYELLF